MRHPRASSVHLLVHFTSLVRSQDCQRHPRPLIIMLLTVRCRSLVTRSSLPDSFDMVVELRLRFFAPKTVSDALHAVSESESHILTTCPTLLPLQFNDLDFILNPSEHLGWMHHVQPYTSTQSVDLLDRSLSGSLIASSLGVGPFSCGVPAPPTAFISF
ncbi:hypothetical protein B0H13DRAFT_2663719 [Mycena leptocephala]|nr:hypothetical protein B0H13DRAFT_2663719 [Mycena leptocephala]